MTIWVCNRRENCLSLECRVSHRNLLTQTRSAHFGLSRRVCGRVMAPKRARDDDGGIVGAKGPGSIAPSAAALDAPPPAPAPAGQDAERAADAVDAILAPSNPGDAAAKVLAAAIEWEETPPPLGDFFTRLQPFIESLDREETTAEEIAEVAPHDPS